MKEHPSSILLIEPKRDGFHLVARETTWRGFARGQMPLVGIYPDKDQARAELCKLKAKAPEARP